MKFEKPYIEISMFNTEDIVTASGTENADFNAAVNEATSLANTQGDKKTAVFKITF